MGKASANATTPSQLVDSVNSHASQPTDIRCSQRPMVAKVLEKK